MKMTDFLVQKLVKARKKENELKKLYVHKKNQQLGFSLIIEMPQLSLAQLGTFKSRLGSAWKIPSRFHNQILIFPNKVGKHYKI